MMQVISTLGAALILAGYFGLQRDFFTREDRWFNVLNFLGSALLAWVAIVDRRIGFIILETVWALLSVPGMIRTKKSIV
jgi:hypothetical protein